MTVDVAFFATPDEGKHYLHKTKVSFTIERGIPYDFQMSDEFKYEQPYLFLMSQKLVKIISPMTNRVVKVIDFSAKVPKSLIPKVNKFDWLEMSHYLECYLGSSSSDFLLLLKLQDLNETSTVLKMGDKLFDSRPNLF